MEKGNIYIPLQGRIGNQLFQYAFARNIQIQNPDLKKIIIDDSDVLRLKWENSLVYYNLPNVEYVHNNIIESEPVFSKVKNIRKAYRFLTKNKDYDKKYKIENRIQPLLNKCGLFICENGYLSNSLGNSNPVYLEGFFQSEKYFEKIKDDIKQLFAPEQFIEIENYPNIEHIINRNTVCISVKVEHNVGSNMYSVCGVEYWKRAIDLIVNKVKDPYFFICSDNVDYVLENLIDPEKYEYTCQSKEFPVHISLSVMAQAKHFIIGNTTFGWWAQYLSKNDDKIVVAPSRWMAIDMPIDIYQEGWHLIEV
ncbi:MAG: alpha-1,2-fucosyltransferase [Oribacterium sp.]|nr:alpha-1,2-fucosyltransferase [Oribacterium sp.]